MINFLRVAAIVSVWLYSTTLASWWVLHRWVGDTLWWLALLSSFAPHLFIPLSLFLVFGLWVRRPLYWSGLLLPITLFVHSYGILFMPRQPAAYQPEPSPLRVMTFNLWGGSHQVETAQVILENGLPDIVALQELTWPMQKLIQQTVGQHYPYMLFDTAIGHRGLGVLSRYPLERVPSDGLIELYCRQYRVTEDVDHRFRLYNCHPRSTNLFYMSDDFATIVRQVAETFQMRTLLATRLAEEIKAHGEPTIVLGDFNTTDHSDAYANLRTVLGDAHRASGWGFGHTFPSELGRYRELPIVPRQVRIDLILYTADFVALESWVGATHAESDHLPLYAVLGWRRTQ
jgi:vancomycin resistance protein VanJ